MAKACRIADETQNPGFQLGQWLHTQWQGGRDCLELVIEDRYAALAAWIEQLIAESLGKDGKGLLPLSHAESGSPNADWRASPSGEHKAMSSGSPEFLRVMMTCRRLQLESTA